MAAWFERFLHALQDTSPAFTGREGLYNFRTCRSYTHLSLQIAQLEKDVKERSKKDDQKEQAEAEAPIINPGGLMGNRLMLTNGYVVKFS